MINASIVLYNHSVKEIAPLVDILHQSGVVNEVFLVDNSEKPQEAFSQLNAVYIYNGKNLGYGAAHNIAFRRTIEQAIPYHLVVNPDIIFQPEILSKLESYMNSHKEVGQLMPKVFYPDGKIQYLCKLLPKPSDLLLRRFLPKSWTKKKRERFEMRDFGYDKVMDVPYLSGSFMFLRTEALEKCGLFDERFFMYPEDIDLTRRIHREYRTIFYPEVSIIHHHAQDSYKSKKMLWVHMKNMAKYFNKWGWIGDKERKKINKEILKQFK